MKFSAWPNLSWAWGDIVELCQHLERSGWDGLWVADHFMPNQADNTGPTGEGWTALSAIAALVPRVRLGTLVTGNTYRHPAVLAKMAAQVDIISGGRLVMGLGAGWQENEHEAYGIPFHTVGGRLRRMEEAAQILRSLFEQEHTTFEGKYYTLKDAPLAPKPVQRPRPPLLIGGGGEKVTMRITAQYADEWNTWGLPDHLKRKNEVLDQHCEDIGRDPKEIRRSANALLVLSDDPETLSRARERGGGRTIAGTVPEVREVVQQYVDAGVDELIVPNFNLRNLEGAKATYDLFQAEVAPHFRD
ncbi:MAG: TIGR03560 family F420-dependent LLM class oxidoreductase [Dehalococcoidia bacterium]|nr:TIGR03560 family F420-dependent LLM class oxidoreductase [Dehalococcoidia bacterium]